jgi:hypothetical protein
MLVAVTMMAARHLLGFFIKAVIISGLSTTLFGNVRIHGSAAFNLACNTIRFGYSLLVVRMRLVDGRSVEALIVIGLDPVQSFVSLELIPTFSTVVETKVYRALKRALPALKITFATSKSRRDVGIGLEIGGS